LSADEAPAPAEVRAALAAAQYEAIVRTLCSLCVWPSDRSLARALLGRGLWPHHTRELVEPRGFARSRRPGSRPRPQSLTVRSWLPSAARHTRRLSGPDP